MPLPTRSPAAAPSVLAPSGELDLDELYRLHARTVAAAAFSGSHQARLSRNHCTVSARPSSNDMRGA